MGNSPSTSSNEGAAVSLPSSIGPLWSSNNSDGQDNGNGPVSSVIKFNLPKYDKVYMKTRLSIPVDNTSYLHLDCSNKGLVLKSSCNIQNFRQEEEDIAICKKGKSGGYDIYKYEPVYQNQLPSTKKGFFLYARVNAKGTVQLVNDEPNKASYVIVNGPKNSHERSLVKIPKASTNEVTANVPTSANDDTNDDDGIDGGDDDEAMSETIAIWKYRDRANRVEVFTDNESGGNSSMTALVFCLVVIADLMSVNSNMNQLGTTAVIASLRPF